jgi:hypothetical protein
VKGLKKKKAKSKSKRSTAAKSGSKTEFGGATRAVRPAAQDACFACEKDLGESEKALFVEEDVGRVFCSEDCIVEHFSPDIERLEAEYQERVSADDFTVEQREHLLGLRWAVLENADEVWREKTVTGDYRYSLMTRFRLNDKPFWVIAMTLFLRGEPSFLYLAIVTRDERLAEYYQRGERVDQKGKKLTAKEKDALVQAQMEYGKDQDEANQSDGLAEPWTQDETLRASAGSGRRKDDIQAKDFEKYQEHLEPTLQNPDEVWTVEGTDEKKRGLFHFIKRFQSATPAFWFIVVAREADEEDQLEILDAFPTKDSAMVDQFRTGTQEMGEDEGQSVTRVLH